MTLIRRTATKLVNPVLPARCRSAFLEDLPVSGGSDSAPQIDDVFAFDLADRYSWSKQAAPADADTVKNLAGKNDGLVYISGGTVSWSSAEQSFGFGSQPQYGAAGVMSPLGWLLAQFGGSSTQSYLQCSVIYLPSAAEWPANGAFVKIHNAGPLSNLGYFGNGSDPGIVLYTNNNAAYWVPAIADFDFRPNRGKWNLVANARVHGEGKYLWMMSLDGDSEVIAPKTAVNAIYSTVGSNDAALFGSPFPDFAGPNHRLHAGAIENLATTGRDWISVLRKYRFNLWNQGVLGR